MDLYEYKPILTEPGVKYFLVDKHSGTKQSSKTGWKICILICYLVIIIGLQVSNNIFNATEKCGGDPQTTLAVAYTLIPNFLIFGVLLVVLSLFPGWKAPFSNTIGYLIVNLPFMKIKDVFNNLLINKDNSNKFLEMIYNDPSIMINNITPNNIKEFFYKAETSKLFINKVQEDKTNYPKLYNLVIIKDAIAEYIWYLLTGALVISNSYSYIMGIKCKRNISNLKSKFDEGIRKAEELQQKKE